MFVLIKMKNLTAHINLKNKILRKKNIISIMGLGYVGLPLAMAFCSSKIKTIGYDVNKKRVSSLKNNKSYISSVGNNTLKRSQKYFTQTSNIKDLEKSDVIIVCVPTPINEISKIPNLDYVKEVILKLKRIDLSGKLIIFECTSYPGTTEEMFLPLVKQKKLILGEKIFLGYSPEREDPGNPNFSLEKKNIPKVISGLTNKCQELTSAVYKQITNKIIKVSNIKTAEFTKLLENIYRSINIGLINELSEISKKFDIDINESIIAAKTKPFGFQPFYPGPGVGGHCIPVDPHYLSWKAKKLGMDSKFIKLAGKINDNRPDIISNNIKKKLLQKKMPFKKILFIGLAYKKNCDDIRNSPIIKIINNFKKLKSKIYCYDPYVKIKKFPFLQKKIQLQYDKLNEKNLKFVDIVVIGTDHDKVDYNLIQKHSNLIFDTRNVYKFSEKNIIKL